MFFVSPFFQRIEVGGLRLSLIVSWVVCLLLCYAGGRGFPRFAGFVFEDLFAYCF